jgi:hypothetical protein
LIKSVAQKITIKQEVNYEKQNWKNIRKDLLLER